jgi:hypothetical protein
MANYNKYRNKKVECDGFMFDSTAEYIRYCQLKIMVRNKMIDRLSMQPEFKLFVAGQHVTTYIGDFQYVTLDELGGWDRDVVEDVKGVSTREYVIKIKLAHALLANEGIEFAEIPSVDVKSWLMRVPDAWPRGQLFPAKATPTRKNTPKPPKKGKGSRNHPKKLNIIAEF